MKNVILLLLLISFPTALAAQEADVRRDYDEIGFWCCEDVRQRLDTFLLELQNDPEARGVVIFYGGRYHPTCHDDNEMRLPRRGELSYLITAIEKHFEFRKFPLDRIKWINGGYKEKVVVQLWHLPKGAETPSPEPTVLKKDIRFKVGKPFRMIDRYCT